MDGSPDIETADIMRLLGEYHEILSHIGPTYGWAFRELMERIEKQMGVSPQRPPAETSDMVGAPASVLGEAFL
jgi:hypothetical protein